MKKLTFLTLTLSSLLILSGCSTNKSSVKDESNKASSQTLEKEEVKSSTNEEKDSKEEVVTPTDSIEEITEVTTEKANYNGFGFIENIYTKENINYLSIDEAEYFIGEEALEEAIKDEKAFPQDDGSYIVHNGYYIRNNYDVLNDYPISENCKFYLSTLIFPSYLEENLSEFEISKNVKEVSFDEFNKQATSQDVGLRVWFNIKNGTIVEAFNQFTP